MNIRKVVRQCEHCGSRPAKGVLFPRDLLRAFKSVRIDGVMALDVGPISVDLIRRDSACWEWVGYRDHGYGKIGLGRHVYMVHRVFYEHFVGPVPERLALDHLCRNRACVNPGHLEAVTWSENTKRGFRAKRIARVA